MVYEYLTVEEAVKELENGNAIFDYSDFVDPKVTIGAFDFYKKRVAASLRAKNCTFSDGKRFRKPLTPEQIIAAGTPLLIQVPSDKTIVIMAFAISDDGLIETIGASWNCKTVKFVINKNGNYITIKDGVADEVLR